MLPKSSDFVYRNRDCLTLVVRQPLLLCPEQDSNLHASRHAHLKRARLPFRHLGIGFGSAKVESFFDMTKFLWVFLFCNGPFYAFHTLNLLSTLLSTGKCKISFLCFRKLWAEFKGEYFRS